LLKPGVKAKEILTDVGDSIKTATVIDPIGNMVGIIENPYFTLTDGG
jgi:hypothetical protein